MAWHSLAGIGSNQGSGSGGPGDVQAPHNQPQVTEYTLQGVMRFLQTEWHRHERDRNSWEIERQEMKGRIAKLEGSTRKSDAGNRALKKYVDILEIALKDRDKLVKELKDGKEVTESIRAKKEIGSRAVKEKQRSERSQGSFVDAQDTGESLDEDPDRENLKIFLDKAQAEVTYLLVSPSNPLPPRETSNDLLSLPFGVQSSQSDSEQIYQQQTRQKNPYPNHTRSSSIPSYYHPQVAAIKINRNLDLAHSLTVEQPTPQSPNQERTAFQTVEKSIDDQLTKINHTFDQYGRETTYEEEKESKTEANGWDFNETDAFPDAEIKPQRPETDLLPESQDTSNSPNLSGSNRRKGSLSRKKCTELESLPKTESCEFKVRYGLRGHLDAVRSVIFTGGGSPGEPEICTTGDDGTIKRWIIPARFDYPAISNCDIDIQSSFTHRGHSGSVMCLTSWSPSQNFTGGGRAQGDGWIFSGGQDATIRVWERGRVGPKAIMHGHTDAVWAVCVLPGTAGSVLGQNKASFGESDRVLIASGSADGSVKVWSVSAPPQSICSQVGSRRGSRARVNSMSSGSGFPSSPQLNIAHNSPFYYTLIHSIVRSNSIGSPTCITPLSTSEMAFVVSYSDAAVLVYDTKSGEEIAAMASLETYDNTPSTGVNAIVVAANRLDRSPVLDSCHRLPKDQSIVERPIGLGNAIDSIIISGHEDRYIRFFDAKSGQCTYNMLAHPAAISALALSPDGIELVSAGHDASLRFWSLEKRTCTQEITSHRLMRGEGICSVSWSKDGRWVVSAGGDGVVKVFAR